MATVRDLLGEYNYLPPEVCLPREDFLEKWLDHNFGLSLDTELTPKEDRKS